MVYGYIIIHEFVGNLARPIWFECETYCVCYTHKRYSIFPTVEALFQTTELM